MHAYHKDLSGNGKRIQQRELRWKLYSKSNNQQINFLEAPALWKVSQQIQGSAHRHRFESNFLRTWVRGNVFNFHNKEYTWKRQTKIGTLKSLRLHFLLLEFRLLVSYYTFVHLGNINNERWQQFVDNEFMIDAFVPAMDHEICAQKWCGNLNAFLLFFETNFSSCQLP